MSTYLSARALENGEAGDKWAPLVEALSNAYSDDKPDGTVIMGIAENDMMRDEAADHIKANFTITPDSHFTYGHGPQGSPKLRRALADFFNDRFNSRISAQPHEFVITSGVSSALDAATWCLCNEGEGILVPRPLYRGFTNDIPTRSRGKVIPVSFARPDGTVSSEDIFDAQANQRAFENALMTAERDGTRIKAVLITNPHNPLARCYPVETLKAITTFCAKHNLQYISDEIYALSVFANPAFPRAPTFQSAFSIGTEGIVRQDMVHVMYGASKDFGANGLRLGAFYTRNERVRLAMQSIITFAWPSYLTQDIWARMLEDKPWLDRFIATNQQRLATQYNMLTNAFDARSITYLKGSNATMFAWVDLAWYINPDAGGKSRRDVEDKIAAACKAKGVMISKASNFQAEIDGWFRITFTLTPKVFELGMRRLFEALDELKK